LAVSGDSEQYKSPGNDCTAKDAFVFFHCVDF
jgi:hypothetical protein